MTTREVKIRFEAFEKRYGEIQAVKPLDLEIARGESFALLGPNGGGKTSILRALVGLHAPSAGRVLVDGLDIVQSPQRARRRLSYVPQRVTMPDLLSVREVVVLFARLKDVAASRVDEVLGTFGLADSADRQVVELSGGMLQRLGLAVAFLETEQSLFVLDEPTANLDPPGVRQLHDLLGDLKRKGTTIVFSSHLLRNALMLADRVGVIVAGEMVEPEEVPAFEAAVTHETAVRVVLSHLSEAMITAVRDAGGQVSGSNGREVSFTAVPERRLQVIRAIERAGGTIEEFHTEAPDWEALIRGRFHAGEEKR